MNKLILGLCLSLITLSANAQKVYFLYIQSESGQPFFIKMNERIHSSNASGYLILSKLRDSTYKFSVGFPQSKATEQQFSVTVAQKDHGYLLKDFGEKGWGLFNLQTLAIQMGTASGAMPAASTSSTANQNVSAFTDILSKAADDPSLREKTAPAPAEKKPSVAAVPEVKKEEGKAATTEIAEIKTTTPAPVEDKKEEPVAAKTEAPKVEEKKEEPKTTPVEQPKTEPATELPAEKKEETVTEVKADAGYKKSTITRKAESSTSEGFNLVFVDDQENGDKDTIRLLIPNPKPMVDPVKEEPKEEKKFLDISSETPKTEKEPAKEPVKETPPPVKEEVKTAPATTVAKTPVVNKCTETASEGDFLKLRKRMAAAENEDEMVMEAKKYFKTKCFTVYQVRNLGNLFLSDAGKYQFYDAAYPYTSDVHNFISLQLELKDEYYVNRFKAMLK